MQTHRQKAGKQRLTVISALLKQCGSFTFKYIYLAAFHIYPVKSVLIILRSIYPRLLSAK
jgi:hypothetical protein